MPKIQAYQVQIQCFEVSSVSTITTIDYGFVFIVRLLQTATVYFRKNTPALISTLANKKHFIVIFYIILLWASNNNFMLSVLFLSLCVRPHSI